MLARVDPIRGVDAVFLNDLTGFVTLPDEHHMSTDLCFGIVGSESDGHVRQGWMPVDSFHTVPNRPQLASSLAIMISSMKA